MATGLLAAAANTGLAAILANYSWAQLHVGDPGPAGTANPAVETTREQATWAAPSGGASSNTGDVTWTNILGSEDPTFISIHTLAVAGSVGLTGTVTSNPYIAGDTVTIAVGDLDVSFPLAS